MTNRIFPVELSSPLNDIKNKLQTIHDTKSKKPDLVNIINMIAQLEFNLKDYFKQVEEDKRKAKNAQIMFADEIIIEYSLTEDFKDSWTQKMDGLVDTETLKNIVYATRSFYNLNDEELYARITILDKEVE